MREIKMCLLIGLYAFLVVDSRRHPRLLAVIQYFMSHLKSLVHDIACERKYICFDYVDARCLRIVCDMLE